MAQVADEFSGLEYRRSTLANSSLLKLRGKIDVLFEDKGPGIPVLGPAPTRLWLLRIIHPNTLFRRTWDVCTALFVLYLTWSVPFGVGFTWYHTPTWVTYFQYLMDAWFAVDILLNFRTGYIKNGIIVMDGRKITRHYVSGWFWLDLVGSVPFDLLLGSHRPPSNTSVKLAKYFKIPKLCRMGRVARYLEEKIQFFGVGASAALLATCIHFFGCIWSAVIIPCPSSQQAYLEECDQDKIWTVYSEMLFTAWCLLSGAGDLRIVISPSFLQLSVRAHQSEPVLFLTATAIMFVGFIVTSILLSHIMVFVLSNQEVRSTYKKRLGRIKHELAYYTVPYDLQEKVLAYFDYIWLHQKQFDNHVALLSDKCMSRDLKTRLALHLYKDVVEHIAIFQTLDETMLGRICQHLSIIIYLPGDTVIKKGEIGQELFILTRGTVEIVNEDLTKRTKKNIALNRGAVFGEIALMMDVRRTSTVCAKTMCELSVLAQHDFDTILLEAPEFAAHMKALVIRRQVEILVSRSSNQATRQDVLERVTVAMNSVMDKKLSSRLQARSALLRTVTEKQLSKIEQALVESVDDSVAHSENKSVQSALVDSTAAPALRPLSDRDVLMEQR